MKGNDRFNTKDLPNTPERKNMQFIRDLFMKEAMNKFEWSFLEFTTPGAVTNLDISHGVGFVPLDLLTTQSSNNITFNFSRFTDKFINITTTGAATFRGLIGRYRETSE